VEVLVTRGPRKKSLFDSVIARKPEDQWRRLTSAAATGEGEKTGNLDMRRPARPKISSSNHSVETLS
jgi:hypothetical protein